MRRWVAGVGFALGLLGVGLSLGLAGCGRDGGPQGPPTGALDVGGPAGVGRGGGLGGEIVMVLPAGDDPLPTLWEDAARVECARLRATLAALRPDPAAGPGGQAALARGVIARRPTALIALPADGQADLGPALAEVRAAGIPVVLLDAALDGAGSPPPTVVTFADATPSLRGLVDATVKAANDLGLPPYAPALLVFRADLGTRGEAQLDTLVRALGAAGVALRPTVRYEGVADKTEAAVAAALKDDPTIRIILGDDLALIGALAAQFNMRPTPTFALGGVAAGRKSLEVVGEGQCAAAVDQNLQALAREAVRVALDLADGRAVPPRVEVPVPLVLAKGQPKARPAQTGSPAPPDKAAARPRG